MFKNNRIQISFKHLFYYFNNLYFVMFMELYKFFNEFEFSNYVAKLF